jgi:hypothetical protein
MLSQPSEAQLWASGLVVALVTFPLRLLVWSTFSCYLVVPYGLLSLPWVIAVWTVSRGRPRRWRHRLAAVVVLPVSWWLLAITLSLLATHPVRLGSLPVQDVVASLLVAPLAFATIAIALPDSGQSGQGGRVDGPLDARVAARVALLVALLLAVGIGLPLSMGRGPGLILGAAAIAGYVLVRGRRIPTLGYVLLVSGLLFTAMLWYLVPIATTP